MPIEYQVTLQLQDGFLNPQGLKNMTIAQRNNFNTPIAAIWTPKRIVAAARAGEIHEAGKLFFMTAGAFDAAAEIAAALGTEGSFKNRVAAAVAAIETDLAEAAQILHDTAAEDFKKHVAGKNALDLIVFGISNGEMSLSHIGFKVKKRGKDVVLQPVQKDYPNAATNIMSIEVLTLGADNGAIESFRKGTTGQQALVYPEQALQKFMQLANAQSAETVKLTAEGATRQPL